MTAMPGAATPAASSPEVDLFAALLASLTADIPAESTPETSASPLPLAMDEPAEDDDTSDGALSAAIAALQFLPQLTPVVPGPLDGGNAPAGVEASTEAMPATAPAAAEVATPPDNSEPTEGNAPPAPPSEAATPAAEAIVDAARQATAGTETTVTEAVPAPAGAAQPVADHQRANPATPGRGDSPTVAATPAGPAMEVVAANRGRRDERRLERERDDPPATEATAAPPQGEQEAADSVVRFDGNADNQGRGNGQQAASKEGNEPNASVQGIAHAAANSAVGELRTADTAPIADVPQPEPAAPAAPAAPEAVEHVGRTIIEKIEQGGGEARLHLRPEALGEVTLHIRTDGDLVHLEIHAERAEAANLLRDNTRDLSQLLGERGLNLADVHVDLSWQGPKNQQGGEETGQQRRPQAEDNSFASLMGLDEPGPAERHNRLRSAYNPDGAMSYRV